LSSQLPDANIVGFWTTYFEVGRHRTLLIFFDTKFTIACISVILKLKWKARQPATIFLGTINEMNKPSI